jgi:hypothetical protein
MDGAVGLIADERMAINAQVVVNRGQDVKVGDRVAGCRTAYLVSRADNLAYNRANGSGGFAVPRR